MPDILDPDMPLLLCWMALVIRLLGQSCYTTTHSAYTQCLASQLRSVLCIHHAGGLPGSWGNLTNLLYLRLAQNNLVSGVIYLWVFSLTMQSAMNESSESHDVPDPGCTEQLIGTGTLPAMWVNMTHLYSLDISSSGVTGLCALMHFSWNCA